MRCLGSTNIAEHWVSFYSHVAWPAGLPSLAGLWWLWSLVYSGTLECGHPEIRTSWF